MYERLKKERGEREREKIPLATCIYIISVTVLFLSSKTSIVFSFSK